MGRISQWIQMSQMSQKGQMGKMCQLGQKGQISQIGQDLVYVEGLGFIRFDSVKI